MVTHDPRFEKHAERIVHLFDGRIVEESMAESENSASQHQ
jgi:ABC-type lipoprotein export system ATPase subunit